jgi:hypothetical protein
MELNDAAGADCGIAGLRDCGIAGLRRVALVRAFEVLNLNHGYEYECECECEDGCDTSRFHLVSICMHRYLTLPYLYLTSTWTSLHSTFS